MLGSDVVGGGDDAGSRRRRHARGRTDDEALALRFRIDSGSACTDGVEVVGQLGVADRGQIDGAGIRRGALASSIRE